MSNYPQTTTAAGGQPSGQTWTNPTWTSPSSLVTPWFQQTPGFGGDWAMQPWTQPGAQQPQQQMMPWGAGAAGTWPMTTNFDFNSQFNRMMRNFESHWWNMQRSIERNFRQMDRRFTSELTYQPSRPASMLEHYSLLNPIRIDGEGNRWLNVYFDLRSYKPDEVQVTLDTKNRCINVEASHEVKETKEHYVKRHYSRRVYIPEDLKIDLTKIELKSCLTNEGLLCVEAALPQLSIEEARAQSTTKAVANAPPGAVFPIGVKVL